MASSETALVWSVCWCPAGSAGRGFQTGIPISGVRFPPVSRQQSRKQQLLLLLQTGALFPVCCSGVNLSPGGSP